MRPGRTRPISATAAALLVLAFGPLHAQSPAPPAMPTGSAGVTEAARRTAPRTTIQLPAAERQALDTAAGGSKPVRIEDALVPSAEDIKPRSADDPTSSTRIEQTRAGNRVSEVIVTPGGQTHSYVMTNRDGRQPLGTTQLNSGLSVPMFLRFEFGKPTPTVNLAPPPSPSPSR